MNKKPKYLMICRLPKEFVNTLTNEKGLPPKGLLGYYNFKTQQFEYNKVNKNVILFSKEIEKIIMIHEMYIQLKDMIIEMKTLEDELKEEKLPIPVKVVEKREYDTTIYNIYKHSNIKNKFKDTHHADNDDIILYEKEKYNREQRRLEKSINGLSRKFNGIPVE
jgi:hypothetical protein